jgi:hypothetical protein
MDWMKRIFFTIFCLAPFTILFAQSDNQTLRSVTKTDKRVCATGNDSFDFTYDVSYPFFSDNHATRKITDSLNKYVRIIAGNYFMDSTLSKSLISVIKKESDSIYTSWKKDLNISFCYNLENTENIELVFSNKRFSTLVNEWYAYDGGAHGVGGEDYIVLDTKTGRKINTWKQLFVDTNLVKSIAKNAFYAQKKRDQCDTADWFWGGEFYVSNNFAVLQQGILFYYQYYEIAPYVFGPTELLLTWDELKKVKMRKRIY